MKASICLEKSKLVVLTMVIASTLCACAKSSVILPQPLPENKAPAQEQQLEEESATDTESQQRIQRLPVLQIPERENQQDSRWQKLMLPEGQFDLNLESVPVAEFIHVALGDVLGLSFFIDPEVAARTDTVTLRISKPVSADRMLGMVAQTLTAYGIGLSLPDTGLQVLPASKLSNIPPEYVEQGADLSSQQGRIITIMPLDYSVPSEVLSIARNFLQIGGADDVFVMQRLNALMVIGDASRIARLKSVVTMVDRPSMAGRQLTLLRPVYWQVSEIIPLLKDALTLQGIEVASNAEAPGVYLLEISQLNAVMIAAPDEQVMKWISTWTKELDTPEVAGDTLRSFVYPVKHSTAKDLGAVVAGVLGGINQQSSRDNSTENNDTQNSNGLLETGANQSLRLVIDEPHNSLVFVGSAQAYKTAYQLLQQLDVPAKQVLLEVTVADVTTEKVQRLGIDWQYADLRNDGSIRSIGGTEDNLGLSGAGLVYQVFDANGVTRARLNALVNDGDAKILSSPKLLAVDNEEARIQVGEQIAVLTQEVDSSSSGANTGLLRNFTYVDTGVILNFIPTVMDNGVVRLKISQEVSAAGASNNNTPPISTRSIDTTLVAQSGSTVMIGGLISSSDTQSDIKVPVLGDIPIIGTLFRNRETNGNSTEMIVLITPHVIETTPQAEALTEAYRSQLGW